ncbi:MULTISPECIES: DUF3047 domain-containing protein [unclassified Polaromonas]|uniref:DUF3047 domain-containing protein n=1 Tax=unclassified Polaromonas TaxID=2638319 RepID=UPI000F082E3E|nr:MULTISPECIES: DUF3047 domain-containing protein [unclassified Polaromonas]AYQ30468.1 DUF3047 domain-containing protein [Polaromonas sp. SP1]QGJ20546.1 DUF3047 domain-containing protein [Polaromonas sp. Pch-P]
MTLSPSHFSVRLLRPLALVACVTVLTACAGIETSAPTDNLDVHWTSASPENLNPNSDLNPDRNKNAAMVKWLHCAFPGKKSTHYRAVRLDGRDAVLSESDSSASMLRQNLRVEPANLGQLSFSWKVPKMIPGADMTQRDSDDSPVRVVLAFDGDRTKFSAKNAMLSELALALTGEPLPYATLMYVWGSHSAPESVIINTRTDRIRKVVIESGPARLGRWLDYERDVRADYEKAFGEAPGALVGIAIMTDSDNTRQQAKAWYGPLSLVKKPRDVLATSAAPSMTAVSAMSGLDSQVPEFAPPFLQD